MFHVTKTETWCVLLQSAVIRGGDSAKETFLNAPSWNTDILLQARQSDMKIFDYPPLIKTDPITEDKKKKIEEMSELVTEFRKKYKIKISLARYL